MRTHLKFLLGCLAATATFASSPSFADPANLKVLGNFTGNKKQVDLVERPFFTELAEKAGISSKVNYSPMDLVNVNASDALRLLRSGAFDIASVQIGMAARDNPFLEGIDIAGVATNLEDQRTVMEAIREEFDKETQKNFNAKVLTLWPFGPQILFCNKPISSTKDFDGKKVRTFTASMADLAEGLGASPVTLAFSEVYLALQRGVADCGITAASAGNSGKWPEVTNYLLPLAFSNSMQGHFINLDVWNEFSEEQQKTLEAEFEQMEKDMWDLAANVAEDAILCNTGSDDCEDHTQYTMEYQELSEEETETFKEIVLTKVLPDWAENCNSIIPDCSERWLATVGEAMGFDSIDGK